MGIHVAVEGLDGSGKTTLVTELATALSETVAVEVTGLPDRDSFAGDVLEDILRHRAAAPAPEVLALTFAANRLDHYLTRVRPVLDNPEPAVIVSHRHLLSGLAYQGMQGLELDWLTALNSRVPAADLTIFLDTPPEVCAERIGRRAGAPELFETKLQKTSAAYQHAIGYATGLGWRIELLDGDQTVPELVAQAADLILATLKSRP